MRKSSMVTISVAFAGALSMLAVSLGCERQPGDLGNTWQHTTSCPQPPTPAATTSEEAVAFDAGACLSTYCANGAGAMQSAESATEQQSMLCRGYSDDLDQQGQFVAANCQAAYQALVALNQCNSTYGSGSSACADPQSTWDCLSSAITTAQNQEKADETNAAGVNRQCASVNATVATCQLENCGAANCAPSPNPLQVNCCATVADIPMTDCCMDGTQVEVDCNVNTGSVTQTNVTECSSSCTVQGC